MDSGSEINMKDSRDRGRRNMSKSNARDDEMRPREYEGTVRMNNDLDDRNIEHGTG